MNRKSSSNSQFRLHSSRGADLRQSASQAQLPDQGLEHFRSSAEIDIVRLRKTLTFESPELQREFDQMFNFVCKLESMIRYKDKDIDRLTYLNKYLSEAQKKRDEMILENQKEIQRLKQLLILYQNTISEIPKKEQKEQLLNQTINGSFQLTGKPGSNVPSQKTVKKVPKQAAKQATKQVTKQSMNTSRSKEDQKAPANKVYKPIGSCESPRYPGRGHHAVSDRRR